MQDTFLRFSPGAAEVVSNLIIVFLESPDVFSNSMFFIAFVCPQQLLHGTLRSRLIFHKHAVLGLICFCRQLTHNLRQVLKLLALVMLRTSQMQYLSNLDQCST